MLKYQNTIDLSKEDLQDCIISIIVNYYKEENKQLKETIKNLMNEKRGAWND